MKKVKTFLTEYRRPDGQLYAGPRVEATSISEAQRKAALFGGVVLGEFVEEIPHKSRRRN